MSLNTEIITKDDAVICYLDGRIVYETEGVLKQVIDDIIVNYSKKILVMNFRDLSYINSSGIGLLVKILKEIKGSGGELRLCCMQPTISDVFKVTNLDQVFNIFVSEEEALGC